MAYGTYHIEYLLLVQAWALLGLAVVGELNTPIGRSALCFPFYASAHHVSNWCGAYTRCKLSTYGIIAVACTPDVAFGAYGQSLHV